MNIPNAKIPTAQQHKRGFAHISQVINTGSPTTTFSLKDTQRISIPSHSTYNQYGYLHQHQQHKSEMFPRNVNYTIKSDNNTLGTVLTYSDIKQSQYEEKFENFDFSSNNMSLDGSNYVEVEQKEFGVGKHRNHEGDENFDSFMETDDENHPIRMS